MYYLSVWREVWAEDPFSAVDTWLGHVVWAIHDLSASVEPSYKRKRKKNQGWGW